MQEIQKIKQIISDVAEEAIADGQSFKISFGADIGSAEGLIWIEAGTFGKPGFCCDAFYKKCHLNLIHLDGYIEAEEERANSSKQKISAIAEWLKNN